MKCTLSGALCTPGPNCYRCGWEEHEQAFRQMKIKSGQLDERVIVVKGKLKYVAGLILKRA